MQVAGCSPCQVQLPGFSMRFEHNLPVLVQPRWLPVGGPYAAFNLPVQFSPMSIGAGGWRLKWPRAAAGLVPSPLPGNPALHATKNHQQVLTGGCGTGQRGQEGPAAGSSPCVSGTWKLLSQTIAVAITRPSPRHRSLPRKWVGEVPTLSPDFTFPSFFL